MVGEGSWIGSRKKVDKKKHEIETKITKYAGEIMGENV